MPGVVVVGSLAQRHFSGLHTLLCAQSCLERKSASAASEAALSPCWNGQLLILHVPVLPTLKQGCWDRSPLWVLLGLGAGCGLVIPAYDKTSLELPSRDFLGSTILSSHLVAYARTSGRFQLSFQLANSPITRLWRSASNSKVSPSRKRAVHCLRLSSDRTLGLSETASNGCMPGRTPGLNRFILPV